MSQPGQLIVRARGILRRLLRHVATTLLRVVPGAWIERGVRRLVAARIRTLAPADALRLLFRLDAALYVLQGEKSVEYGQGLHSKHRHTRYHDFFVQRVHPGERVLDLGCGHGALAYDIADRAQARVLALDLNPHNIELARAQHAHPDIEYRVGDVLRDLDREPFDVVILSNVLEHLSGRVEFLRLLAERTGASRALIRVPLFERDWRVPLKRELGVEWRLDPTHETEYTLESFAEEISKAGWVLTQREIRWGELWAEVAPADA